MGLVKEKWTDISTTELINEAGIRALHRPNEAHRISWNKYGAGVRTPELVGLPYTVYVVDGSCRYAIGGFVVEAQKGELIRIVPGDYLFEVGDSGVTLYRDFLLPKVS
jgi:hypothetical protein